MTRRPSHARPRPPTRPVAAFAALLASALVLGLATAQAAAQPSRVVPWGVARPAESGPALEVSADGVIVLHNDAPELVGWHRVQRIEGPLAASAEPFMPAARDAWRAAARLDRGDAVNAEPLFEALFETYAGRPGPTAAVVAEGLLVCRLRAGARAAAVRPWLSFLNAGPRDARGRMVDARFARGLVDPDSGLVPSLGPFWRDGPAARALGGGDLDRAALAPREAAFAALYRAAARFETGLPPDGDAAAEVARLAAADPAVAFVRDLVLARAGGPAQREDSRRLLERSLRNDTPPWQEAWARVGLGRSLVREDDPERVRRGLVQLLHVPARFADERPWLAGFALAEAAETLDRTGRQREAIILRREAARRFPGHPAFGDAASPPAATAAETPA